MNVCSSFIALPSFTTLAQTTIIRFNLLFVPVLPPSCCFTYFLISNSVSVCHSRHLSQTLHLKHHALKLYNSIWWESKYTLSLIAKLFLFADYVEPHLRQTGEQSSRWHARDCLECHVECHWWDALQLPTLPRWPRNGILHEMSAGTTMFSVLTVCFMNFLLRQFSRYNLR